MPARSLAVCLWLLVLPPAWAQQSAPSPTLGAEVKLRLDAAARLYEELEYERAQEQVSRAKSIARGVDEDVAVALYEGILLTYLSKADQASVAFKTALYLRPCAPLPLPVSPRVSAEFEALRQQVLSEQPKQARRECTPPKTADAPIRPKEPQKPLVKVEPAQPPDPAPPLLQADTHSRPMKVLPISLLGAGLVAGGVGGYLGLQSRSQIQVAREAEFYDERVRSLDSAGKQARAANILFGVAGAAAVGAAVTFFTSNGDASPAGGGK